MTQSDVILTILATLWCLGGAMETIMLSRHIKTREKRNPTKMELFLTVVFMFVAWPYTFTFGKR